jgi:hypothetical protein
MNIVENKYNHLKNSPSDINEHLETLYKYATNCESVIELGVRGCVSSWALLNGLLHNNSVNKKMFLNDLDKCDISEFLQAVKIINEKSETTNKLEVGYEWISDLELNVTCNYDLTFIDTWHIYGQLKRELNKFSKVTNKYIIMHDTTVDEIYGENIRMKWNIKDLQKKSGFTEEELTTGLKRAIDEFLIDNRNWVLKEKFTNNNGLTILERVN